MSTSSTLKVPVSGIHPAGIRRLAAIVLVMFALIVGAFVIGRVTATSNAATTVVPAHLSSTLLQLDGCRPHVPC